jgi:glycine cleavage system H protein
MGDWKTPADCKYTKTDEWIRAEGSEALIGLTDYAQDQLSDLVFVEFPAVGDSFAKGEAFGVVESVKAAADVNMPVGGEVVATNEALANSPETINSDPFGAGWLIRIKLSDPPEMDDLMDAAAYAVYCVERA